MLQYAVFFVTVLSMYFLYDQRISLKSAEDVTSGTEMKVDKIPVHEEIRRGDQLQD